MGINMHVSTNIEIDYLEEKDAILSCYEFKWSPSKTKTVPSSFIKAYPNRTYQTVHRENYESFIGLNQVDE